MPGIARRTTLLTAGATALALAAGLPASAVVATTGPTGTGTSPVPAVTAAHLTLTIRSTSNWTAISISPGAVIAQRLTKASGPGVWSTANGGVSLSGAGGVASTVTDDLVVSEATGANSFTWHMTKGYIGTTSFTVTNDNGTKPTAPVTYTDAVASTALNGLNPQVATVPRQAVMGGTPLTLPRVDSRKLVLADYYPWWSTSYAGSTLADTPLQPRSTSTLAGVESMTAQAKANGVNGFLVSWDGQAGHGSQFQLALQAAQDQGQVVTGYLETHAATNTSAPANTEYLWLEQLLAYAKSSAFLKTPDGTPVVFVYDMADLSTSSWQAILTRIAIDGYRVHLVGDAADPSYLPFEWGLHSYTATAPMPSLTTREVNLSLQAKAGSVLNPTVTPKAYVATVSPGYNDSALRGTLNAILGRDNGNRYAATWAAALAGQPDWVLVTSWNEWFEGTAIEPGVLSGSQALTQTGQEATAWRSAP